MGLEAAGMRTGALCEIDPWCQKVLRRHWPDIPIYTDVSTVTATQLLADGVKPDVVAFGSPCQDLSIAGRRAGLAGSRSGLFGEAVRIIRELRKETDGTYPRVAVWENVVGALSSSKGDDFAAVLDSLADAGALVLEWAVLDAQHFGVPQRRRRIFLVAIFDPDLAERCPEPLLPVREGRPGDLAKGRKARQDAASRAEPSAVNGRPTDDVIAGSVIGLDIAAPLMSNSSGGPRTTDLDGATFVASSSEATVLSEDADTVNATWWDGSETAPTLTRNSENQRMPDKGQLSAVIQPAEIEPLIVDGRRVDDVRVWEDGIMPTLAARMGTGGNNVPFITQDEPVDPVIMRQREGKPGGGKGPLLSEDSSLTLGTSNDQYLFQPADQPIYSFDSTFGGHSTVSEEISPTIKVGTGLGISSPPAVAQPIAFTQNQREEVRDLGDVAACLQAEGGMHLTNYIAQPDDTEAIPIQGTMIGRADTAGPQGRGYGDEGDPMYTLDTISRHGVAQPMNFDEYNFTGGEDTHQSLRAGTRQSTGVVVPLDDAAGFKPGASADARSIGYEVGLVPTLEAGGGGNNRPAVMQPVVAPPLTATNDPSRSPQSSEVTAQVGAVFEATMVVRRLTPVECERLMGWADDHTRWTAEDAEIADSHRYKMCGNGVASPVAEWVGRQVMGVINPL